MGFGRFGVWQVLLLLICRDSGKSNSGNQSPYEGILYLFSSSLLLNRMLLNKIRDVNNKILSSQLSFVGCWLIGFYIYIYIYTYIYIEFHFLTMQLCYIMLWLPDMPTIAWPYSSFLTGIWLLLKRHISRHLINPSRQISQSWKEVLSVFKQCCEYLRSQYSAFTFKIWAKKNYKVMHLVIKLQQVPCSTFLGNASPSR